MDKKFKPLGDWDVILSALTALDNEIKHRKLIQGAAIKIGCENLPTMVANRSEIAELEQIRANLEAIQGGGRGQCF